MIHLCSEFVQKCQNSECGVTEILEIIVSSFLIYFTATSKIVLLTTIE